MMLHTFIVILYVYLIRKPFSFILNCLTWSYLYTWRYTYYTQVFEDLCKIRQGLSFHRIPQVYNRVIRRRISYLLSWDPWEDVAFCGYGGNGKDAVVFRVLFKAAQIRHNLPGTIDTYLFINSKWFYQYRVLTLLEGPRSTWIGDRDIHSCSNLGGSVEAYYMNKYCDKARDRKVVCIRL